MDLLIGILIVCGHYQDLVDRIKNNQSLTVIQKEELIQTIKEHSKCELIK